MEPTGQRGVLDHFVGASLNNPFLALLFAMGLFVGGSWIAATFPVDVFPDLTAPTVTVVTDAQGLASEDVEVSITFPIETALNGALGVRRVRSRSAHGISIVWADFEWGTDIFLARQVVAARLQAQALDLPQGIDPPVLAPISSIMGEIMLVGLSAPEGQLMEVRTLADWVVRRRLLAVPGVSQVIAQGGDVREYQVLVDPQRLLAYRVGLEDVLAATSGSSENVSGGLYWSSGREVLIRGIVRPGNVDDIAETVVATRGRVPVLIEDIAEVRIGPRITYGTGSVNGEPAVILSVQKQAGANTLELTRRVDAELDQIEADLPEGVTLEREIFRQADFISLAVDNVILALRDGALFVIAILFFFLWNARTTLISVVAIPLSLALAIVVMRVVLGGTVNTMTLGGMAIAIGALVDDAIIFVENVHRRLRDNRRLPYDERQAPLPIIRAAASEIREPILNATLIITIVFVPLFFLSGVEGRMLRPLGEAYVVSILSSLVVAVTVTPALCYLLLPSDRSIRRVREPWLVRALESLYRRVLDWALRRSGRVLIGSALLLVATVAVVPTLGREFLPEFQEGSLTLALISVPGTSLDESDGIGGRVERRLLGIPGVVSTARRTGRAEMDEEAQGSNSSHIEVRLDLTEREFAEVVADVRAELAGIAGTSITVGQPIGHRIDHMLSGTRAAIAVSVFGPDLRELREIAGQIETVAHEVEGLVDISVEQQAEVPQLQVRANRRVMARYGVTPGTFADAVHTAMQGEAVSVVREGERSFDLVVRYADQYRSDPVAIGSALMATAAGPIVPLSQLGSIVQTMGPNMITRENVQRKIVVSANVAGRDVIGAVTELQEHVAADLDLPSEYFLQYGGQFESGQSATRTITILSLFSIGAIFAIMFRAFGSFRTAMFLMVNLPLALTGGVIAVLLIGGTVNVATLVGFITLFGIAVRNGMLLVSRYQDLCATGVPLPDSVRRGSVERLSPILMTALTAGLALIPLALGIGEPGKEIQAPLAVVVLGGLTTSTALNMIVVPALFMRYGKMAVKAPAAAEGPLAPARS
ncbi:MAG: efflux RND transporter permease subunit [Gemmatimonadota bacterium]|nr:efflux RND transporter permease subunit [Gemmatimonadota bacterium]